MCKLILGRYTLRNPVFPLILLIVFRQNEKGALRGAFGLGVEYVSEKLFCFVDLLHSCLDFSKHVFLILVAF